MNSTIIKERIAKLREKMMENGISLYMITTMDFHMSEIPSEYFKTLEYISGFTGSEGKMIITENHVHLWTDGRYALQSKKELKDTGIQVHIYSDKSDDLRKLTSFFTLSGDKMFFDAIEKAPSDKVILANNEYVIGCDGRTFSEDLMQAIKESMHIAYESGIVRIRTDLDLVGEIWTNRPKFPKGKIFKLDDKLTGESALSKINRIKDKFILNNGDMGYICSTLDDIAWLLNLRGNDISCSPVFLSYLYLGPGNNENYLFTDSSKLGEEVYLYLDEIGIRVKKYDEFYTFIENVEIKYIALDPDRSNAAIIDTLDNRKDLEILELDDIIENEKAIKNKVEIENIKRVNKLDAVAMIKFIKWLKDDADKVHITEVTAADYLELLRRQQGCFELSFKTICAYGPNGAIIHYTADEFSNAEIRKGNFLLIDSGGHYMGGTTDITRTLALGNVDDKMKENYTKVLAGNLELSMAKFPFGVSASELDIYARASLWKNNLDYDHGTGHGIGYMLNVHEGPQSINYRKNKNNMLMLPGMLTSNEPGLYLENQYGIRHENDILCIRENEDFLIFENVTLVPFDLDAIDKKYLTKEELAELNSYHQKVYEEISPMLDTEHKEWLRHATREI